MLFNRLINAIEQNNFEEVKHVISLGAKFRADSDYALECASKHNRLEIFKYLHRLGADIRSKISIINASLRGGHTEIIRYIHSVGVSLENTCDYGDALSLALQCNNVDFLKFIESLGFAICNKHIYTACANGQLEIVKYLVSSGFVMYSERINTACACGQLELVKYFVSSGLLKPADYFGAPLQHASCNGKLDIVRYLVSLGNFAEINLLEALRSASSHGHLEVVKFIDSLGFKLNYTNAISVASTKHHLEIVKYLVSRGATIKDIDDIIISSIFSEYSCYYHSDVVCYSRSDMIHLAKLSETAKYLLLHNANINLISHDFANKLAVDYYNDCEFECVANLSKHANDAIKKSIDKIQRQREFFHECMRKNNYVDISIVTIK